MRQSLLTEVIPDAKRTAVEKALRTVFHTEIIENIRLLSGGLSSALVYCVQVNRRFYVLRVDMQRDSFKDPVRQFTCMNIASDVGIAPRVYYTEAEDAVSLTNYIEHQPLSGHFSSPNDKLRELVKTVKAIHDAPLFPKLINYWYLDGVDRFIQQFQELGMLPESATVEYFRYYAEIQSAYPRHHSDLVSSHNDLNPNNILFDGKKIWVIDWESAFQNDRYVDLAITANYFAANEAQEEFCLKAYFGEALDDYKRARFFLMQQVCRLLFAMIMMKLAAASQPVGWVHDDNMNSPCLRDFHKQLGTGAVSLASYDGQLLYAKVLLNEALFNMKTPKFAASIRNIL